MSQVKARTFKNKVAGNVSPSSVLPDVADYFQKGQKCSHDSFYLKIDIIQNSPKEL